MKRIVILGAGESGAGAAVLAKKEGFDVFVSDMSAIRINTRNCLTTTPSTGRKSNIPRKRFSRPTRLSKAPAYQKRHLW